MSCYRNSKAQRDHYSVRLLCQLVQVPASGCYAWQQVQQQKVAQREPAWETVLVKAFGVPKRCYRTCRLRVELRCKGYRVGRQRLRSALRRRGLHALQPKAFTPHTTDSTHGLRCAPNCLLDQPRPTQVKVFVPLVAPQNSGARRPRAARFCRLSRCPSQRSRPF